jgi:hypothetical protein
MTAADNKCCDSLRQAFMSRAMSKAVKIKIYKMMVKAAAVFGSETVAMAVTEVDMNRLSAWERVILRRVHGLMVQQGIWRVKADWELRELYKDLDIADIGMDWTCSKNGSGKES